MRLLIEEYNLTQVSVLIQNNNCNMYFAEEFAVKISWL